jgi:lipopolysaccharide assembly protein A
MPMRIVYLFILLLLVGVVGVFVVQNSNLITLYFFDWSVSSPISLLTAVIYLLGMVSGGTVVGFVQRSYRRVTERTAQRSDAYATAQRSDAYATVK